MSQSYSRFDIDRMLQDRGFDIKGQDPIYQILYALGEYVQATWKDKVSTSRLNAKFRMSYRESIAIRVDRADWTVVVGFPVLADQDKTFSSLALMAELGFGGGGIGDDSPYDLRRYMFNGKLTVHHTKDGRAYVNVPMNKSSTFVNSWATEKARSSQERIQEELAKIKKRPHTYAADVLGNIRRAPGETGKDKNAVYALRNSVEKLKARHKADPFDWMIKVAATYSQKTDDAVVQTSEYRIWRRMYQTNTDGSWMHPGTKGLRLADTLLQGKADALQKTAQALVPDLEEALKMPRQGA